MTPNRRGGKLRNKIIAWSFIPTATILVAVAVLVFLSNQQVTEEFVIERNQALAQILAQQQAGELGQYARQLQLFASGAPVDNLNITFDGGVLCLDDIGRVIATYPHRPSLLGQDLGSAPYFQQTHQLRQPTWSDIEAWGPIGNDVFLLSVPMAGNHGEFRGAAVGMFQIRSGVQTRNSAFYTNAFAKMGLAEKHNVYIVDRHGQAVLHSDTYRIGSDVAGQVIVQRVLSGELGGIRTRDPDGNEIVASYAPVPGTSWSLVIEENWADLTSISRRYQQLLLGLLILATLVPVAVIAVGAGRITRPIAELTSATQRMANGDLSGRITTRTGDEVELLAEQFNQMATRLQTSYATLESRVADRTRELAALNTVAAVVSRSLDLSEILQAALNKTREITAMESGCAMALDSNGEPAAPVAQHGSIPDDRDQHGLAARWETAGEQAKRTAQPVVQTVTGSADQQLASDGSNMILCIPLVSKGRVLGLINLAGNGPHGFANEELSLLAAIGQQVGVAVENAQLAAQAKEAAAAAERNRLARELHDAVTQTLFSATLIADAIPQIWERDPAEGRKRLNEVRTLTRGALAEMRNLLLELRPTALIKADFGELLHQLAEAATGRADVPISVEIEQTCELPTKVKIAFYRIAQEAINNIIKHANATQVSVRYCCQPAGASLKICDNGCGFDLTRIHPEKLGLGIMQERAQTIGADFEINSRVGGGTQLFLTYHGGNNDRDQADSDLVG